jgi:hypothetical protein
MVSRQIVVIHSFEEGMTISAFLKKLRSVTPNHGVTKQQILCSPVLVEEKTVLPLGYSVEDVALIIIGLQCASLDSPDATFKKCLMDKVQAREAILGQKGLPQYLWHIYAIALQALEKLM